jgi:hypothetical protein
MWQAKFDLPDDERDRARTLIATIEQRLASDTAELRAAWRELVALLAIEQRAETRACHNCRRLSCVAAKRCAYCWHTLEPRSMSPRSTRTRIAFSAGAYCWRTLEPRSM